MWARLVEGLEPYREGTGIEITDDWVAKYINVKLRALNNLIICNDDNELYTDLQLEDWLNANDEVPVGVLTGRVLQADWWPQTWTLLSWKTTSWDLNQFLWGNDWNLYFRDGNWVWHTLTFQDGTYKCAVISDDGQGNVSLSMQYLALAQALAQDADSINWLFQNRGSTGQIHIEIVSSLPATWSADTIYFVSDGQWGYDEYIWDAANNTWINVGGISIDLSNYVDKTTNQSIGGQKTFLLEPILPSKSSAPTNNPTSPATEAQLFNLAQDLAGKQDTLTAWDWIDITSNVVSIYSAPATQWQVLTKGANWVEWTTPQGWGQTYNSWVGIDIDANNDINIDTTWASTWDVLKKTNNWVWWDTIKEFEPSNTGTSGQVLKRDAQWGYSWENEWWWGGGWGWTTYYAWDGINIDSSHNISIDKTGATQGQVMSVDGQGNIVWINQAVANARIYYVKDDNNVDTSFRTWVYVIDPATMSASWETYTPQDGDIVICYFTNWCKIGWTYEYKDALWNVVVVPNSINPSLTIWSTTFPIYVNNNLADYYHFHMWAWAWVMLIQFNNCLYAINTQEVVNVYPWEAWRLPDAIRELKRTRVDISQADYEALVLAWQVDPDCWYYIHA